MLLKLLSNAFTFEKGTALAMPYDVAAEGGMEAWVNRGNSEGFSPVMDDAIELTGVNRAGEYQLMAGELTVQRVSDGLSFPIAIVSGQFNVTDENLKHGRANMEIAAQSVFKVTVLDRDLQPIPQRRLTFFADGFGITSSTGGPLRIASIGVKSDENGIFYFLGNNPSSLWFILDAETGLSIVPV